MAGGQKDFQTVPQEEAQVSGALLNAGDMASSAEETETLLYEKHALDR